MHFHFFKTTKYSVKNDRIYIKTNHENQDSNKKYS